MTESEENKAFIEKIKSIQICRPTFKGHYNHGLGGYVESPNAMKNLKNKVEGETGVRLEEVGDQKADAHLGSNNNNYNFSDSEMRQITKELGG